MQYVILHITVNVSSNRFLVLRLGMLRARHIYLTVFPPEGSPLARRELLQPRRILQQGRD